MAQTNSTTVSQYPLERSKIKKKVIAAMIGWTIILVIALVLLLAFSLGKWVWILIVIFAIALILQIWYQTEYYNRYYYNLSADFLDIRKGVILPNQTMLPYEKLQDVYMDQDLLDRLFNLWDVHVSTATAASGYAAHIDGVKLENAEALRNLILGKIRRGKDAGR